MTVREAVTGRDRRRAPAADRFPETVLAGDLVWIAVPVCASLVVYAAYLLSHQYPAYGAGLYLQMAEQVRVGGYHPPVSIDHYTAGGIPFAYPPLTVYVAAVVHDLTGVAPMTYARVVPGFVVTATVVPYYYLAREFLGSRPRASLAAVVVAVAPPVLRWHLSAGGIVRTPAFLFALASVYGGAMLFRAGDRRWIVPTAVVLGLTALSHPVYPVYVVLSFLLMYAVYDRSLRGIAAGVAVGAGGLALSLPWVWWVTTTHGLGSFAAAAGTHSGLWGGTYRISQEFVQPVAHLDTVTPFYAVAFLGAGVALVRRRPFLPVWMGLSGYVLAEGRFLYVAGGMLVALVTFEGVGMATASGTGTATATASDTSPTGRRTVVAAVVVAAAAVTIGTLFAAGAIDPNHGGRTQPAFLDTGSVRAATWVQGNTDPAADFVVVGDLAEWFPSLADRTSLVGPWGVEWRGNAEYVRQIRLFESISACDSAGCLSAVLDRADVHPEYVVVPKDHYTVRGRAVRTSTRLRRSLLASDRYTLTYETPDTMVFFTRGGDSPHHDMLRRRSARGRRTIAVPSSRCRCT